ncbi:Uncharacterised protein [Nocardia brasiliensis]|nr:Uncharacterised protein [Nocardia brasiliensis]
MGVESTAGIVRTPALAAGREQGTHLRTGNAADKFR